MKNFLRKNESGQAIMELAVSLVGILAVFVGLLFVSALGLESIYSVIEARHQADYNSSMNQDGGTSGAPILEWSFGPDGLPQTADDQPVFSDGVDNEFFKNQTRDDDGLFDLDASVRDKTYVLAYNFAADYSIWNSSLLVNAANLSGSTVSNDNPLQTRELTDLQGVLRPLFGINGSDVRITERCFMPKAGGE